MCANILIESFRSITNRIKPATAAPACTERRASRAEPVSLGRIQQGLFRFAHHLGWSLLNMCKHPD